MFVAVMGGIFVFPFQVLRVCTNVAKVGLPAIHYLELVEKRGFSQQNFCQKKKCSKRFGQKLGFPHGNLLFFQKQ